MHNERKVFGRICPNRIGNSHSRTEDKKPATNCGKQDSAKKAKNNVSFPIYIEDQYHVSIVDEAFATIAWGDLADCTSVLRQESDSSDHQTHVSGFEIQDFVDSTVNFIPESPSLLDCSGCSSGSHPLSDCSLSDFSGCSVLPVSSLLDTPPRENHSHEPPVPPQAQAPPPDTPEDQFFWSSLAEHHQRALGDALDANDQLCRTLEKKQEETRLLQQRNLHLKELANQAKHLASVLSRLVGPSGAPPPPGALPVPHSPTKRRRLEGRSEAGMESGAESGAVAEGEPAGEEVRRILRDVSERCRAVLREQAGEGGLPRPRMHGAFQGLLTSTPQRGQRRQADGEEEDREEEESTAFRTSIRDHCTIRTLAFPQGHAFTSRSPEGGCRFRWIPS